MPRAKSAKVSKKTPVKKKVPKNTACSLGFCGDEEKLNICEAKRPPTAQVIKEQYGAVTREGRTFYFDTIFKRFFAFRLFQEDFGLFTKFKLHDISIYLEIWTYHHDDHTQTIQIPTNRGNALLTPLISKMKIKSFILEICNDRDLAKKKNTDILASDILLDQDFQDIQFNKDKVKVIDKQELEIDCTNCTFTQDKLIMCLDLGKMDVCLSNRQSNTESAIFDKGNYLFVMFIDYVNFMYNFKKKTLNDEFTAYQMGENYDFAQGHCGIPSYVGDGYIEMAWSPHVKGSDIQRLYAQVGDCCDKQE